MFEVVRVLGSGPVCGESVDDQISMTIHFHIRQETHWALRVGLYNVGGHNGSIGKGV